MNEQTIELIAQRVIAALREDLETIAAELSTATTGGEQLTVGQVARRLGVARSTVYGHWREWGGYKLGPGEKAPIRFDSSALPIAGPRTTSRAPSRVVPSLQPRRRKRRQRDLLADAPRITHTADQMA